MGCLIVVTVTRGQLSCLMSGVGCGLVQHRILVLRFSSHDEVAIPLYACSVSSFLQNAVAAVFILEDVVLTMM